MKKVLASGIAEAKQWGTVAALGREFLTNGLSEGFREKLMDALLKSFGTASEEALYTRIKQKQVTPEFGIKEIKVKDMAPDGSAVLIIQPRDSDKAKHFGFVLFPADVTSTEVLVPDWTNKDTEYVDGLKKRYRAVFSKAGRSAENFEAEWAQFLAAKPTTQYVESWHAIDPMTMNIKATLDSKIRPRKVSPGNKMTINANNTFQFDGSKNTENSKLRIALIIGDKRPFAFNLKLFVEYDAIIVVDEESDGVRIRRERDVAEGTQHPSKSTNHRDKSTQI